MTIQLESYIKCRCTTGISFELRLIEEDFSDVLGVQKEKGTHYHPSGNRGERCVYPR